MEGQSQARQRAIVSITIAAILIIVAVAAYCYYLNRNKRQLTLQERQLQAQIAYAKETLHTDRFVRMRQIQLKQMRSYNMNEGPQLGLGSREDRIMDPPLPERDFTGSYQAEYVDSNERHLRWFAILQDQRGKLDSGEDSASNKGDDALAGIEWYHPKLTRAERAQAILQAYSRLTSSHSDQL